MIPDVPSGLYSLFLDVDGTLLDIAPRPEAVTVPDTLRDALRALTLGLDGAVALVSGRTIDDLDGLFAPLRLCASGVHGAETRFDSAGSIQISPEHLLSADLITTLRDIAARYPGTLVENKLFSVAIHFRAIPAAGANLRRDLETLLQSPAAQDCRLLPGHMVFEVKRGGFDKGTAIAALLRVNPFAGRTPIFIGDDVTDLPAFEQALANGGLAYSVTTTRPGLSGHFPDPSSVRSWLGRAAQAFEADRRGSR